MSDETTRIIEASRDEIAPFIGSRREKRQPRKAGSKIARTIAFTSGKGGVGKTNLVANVAICMAQAGKRVIILDGDLGLANIDVVFGIRPKHCIVDVLSGKKTIDEILIPGPKGVSIIPGGSGIKELAALTAKESQRFLSEMQFLEDRADYVLIDTGAGISPGVIDFCLAADEVAVVTNPEPTAMADAYGIIKVIGLARPEARVGVLVNRAENAAEGHDIFSRIHRVAREFMQFHVHDLGHVVQDKQMYLAVRQQTPLLLFAPVSPAARCIRDLVHHQWGVGLAEPTGAEATPEPAADAPSAEGFFSRLARRLGGNAA